MVCPTHPISQLGVQGALAENHETDYPSASCVLMTHVYVDDILPGASTLQQAEELKRELIALLGRANFNLKKWASNCPGILADICANEGRNCML